MTSEDAYGYCTSSGGDNSTNNEFSVFEEGTTEPALHCYCELTAVLSVTLHNSFTTLGMAEGTRYTWGMGMGEGTPGDG